MHFQIKKSGSIKQSGGSDDFDTKLSEGTNYLFNEKQIDLLRNSKISADQIIDIANNKDTIELLNSGDFTTNDLVNLIIDTYTINDELEEELEDEEEKN